RSSPVRIRESIGDPVDKWVIRPRHTHNVDMKHALPLPTDLIPLAESQGGAFSRQQFLALGGHQRQIDRALRNDSWIRLGQGIYSLQRSPTFETYCWGGLL